MYRADRESGHTGGGVALLIHESLDQKNEERLQLDHIQILCVTCTLGRELNVMCMYRSPASPASEDQEMLNYIEEYIRNKPNILILGDFNAPEVDWTSEAVPPNTFGVGLLRLCHSRDLCST